MKFEIENGAFVGTAEWRGPGRVSVEMSDAGEKAWFERYFGTEFHGLAGTVDCPQMHTESPTESEAAFERAMQRLSDTAYKVRRADGARTPEPSSAA